VVRLRDREVSIKAPARFLQALFRWCDGHRSLSEIAVLADAKLTGSRFNEFVRAMLECGVLTDERFAVIDMLADVQRHREQLAEPHVPGAQLAPPSTACLPQENELDIRLGPPRTGVLEVLGAVLRELDAASRAMATPHAHAQPLHAAVVLREAVDDIAPGAFHVIFCDDNVLLRPAAALDMGLLLGATASPYQISCSMGAVVVFAGGRLSAEPPLCPADRALVVAGAAIERMRARAGMLELTWQSALVRDADSMRTLCAVDRGVLADAILFGKSRSSSGERIPAARCGIDLRWIGTGADLLGYHIAEAVVHSNDRREPGWGRSTDAQLACAKAVSEAVERYAFSHPPQDLLRAAGRQLACKLNPTAIVRYSQDQYRQKRGTLAPYDDDIERLWVAGKDWHTGDELWIPADCVYSGADLPLVDRPFMLMRQTSSGCASDTSLATALERAGLEVVERDALARHWLAQQAGVSLAPGSVPASLASRIDAIKDRALEIDLCVLQGDLGPVVLVLLTSVPQGFCVAATACGDSALHSVERALAEAEVAALGRSAHMQVERLAARSVRRPLDHANLYGQRRYHRRAHVISRGTRTMDLEVLERNWPASLAERLGRVSGAALSPSLSSLAASPSGRAAWVDMTRDDAPLSLDGQPIRTVRVLIPGAIPIGFGYDALPRGMGAACARGGSFPHPLS
jgi:ribosomal protein S12 methylthiotransferase accessory factor